MKSRILPTLALLLAGLCTAAAAPINITMTGATAADKVETVAKNSIPTGSNSNGEDNHFAWLDQHVVPWYNAAFGTALPDPSGLSELYIFGSVKENAVPTISLAGVTYITFHYGNGGDQAPAKAKGPKVKDENGNGNGGGGYVFALYHDGSAGTYTPVAKGISTMYVWGTPVTQVPDSASVAALLGVALMGLAFVRRR